MRRLPSPWARQRGAATLVVVMVLFFIISMVAAYTSRNMIFEQRTGANLYRGSQSIEAAEAGMEWALMMLNGGRIDDSCVASTDLTDSTFRDRYTASDAVTGLVSARLTSGGAELTPTCVFDRASNRWVCSCPVDGAPVLAAPAGAEVAPAFRIRMRTLTFTPPRQGLLRLDVVGCTRLDDSCLALTSLDVPNEGRTVLGSLVILSGRAVALPSAALTARGSVTASGLGVSNVNVSDTGITVHASGSIDTAGLSLSTIAGNALGGTTLPGDSGLNLPDLGPYTAAERFFSSTFVLPPQRWTQLPGVFTLTCGSGGCSAADVRTAIAQNPGRPLWLTGGLSVDTSGDIGTAASPVTLVVNGNLDFSTTGVTLYGLVMLRPADPVTGWVTSGSGRIVGAVIVDGAVTGTSTVSVDYNGVVLDAMRFTTGSYSRVSGSWRDWATP